MATFLLLLQLAIVLAMIFIGAKVGGQVCFKVIGNNTTVSFALRRMLPDVMRRCLHVQIGNRSYGAFGNLFLLRWARKIQVFCHRKHPVTGEPYELTADYASDQQQWDMCV